MRSVKNIFRIHVFNEKFGKLEILVFFTLISLVLLEAALQFRAQWQSGRSVFTALAGESRIVVDTQTGVRRLAANTTFRGDEHVVRTNALGLRGPDIAPEPADNDLRIAVTGASSIYGAEAARNADTIPTRLQRALQERLEGREVEVINAGVPGARIDDIRRLLTQVVLPLRPDIVIFYPGFQQISAACGRREGPSRQSAPWVSLPDWSLVYDLTVKNTRFLREKPGIKPVQPPPEYDPSNYRQTLKRLAEEVELAGAELFLATGARGYRQGLDAAENRALARNTLNFADCLTPNSLIAATRLFNNVIREVATKQTLQLIDLSARIPGGWSYFADGNHFNDAGKRRVTRIMAERIATTIQKNTARGDG